MGLNWTLFSFYDICSTIAMFCMFFVTVHYYRRDKYPHLRNLSLIWLVAGIGNFFYTISHLFIFISLEYSIFFFRIFFLLMPLQLFFSILFVDLVTRDSVDPIKLTIWGFLTGMLVLVFITESVFYVEEVYPGIYEIRFQGQILNPIYMCISIYWGLLFLIFGVKVLSETPKKLLRTVILAFIGILCVIFRGIFSFQLNSINPIISFIFLIVGFGLLLYAFVRYPALAFILPFKVVRLNILDVQSGITIFTHDFGGLML